MRIYWSRVFITYCKKLHELYILYVWAPRDSSAVSVGIIIVILKPTFLFTYIFFKYAHLTQLKSKRDIVAYSCFYIGVHFADLSNSIVSICRKFSKKKKSKEAAGRCLRSNQRISACVNAFMFYSWSIRDSRHIQYLCNILQGV